MYDEETHSVTCGKTFCRCTHLDPCDRGWVNSPDQKTVMACETCKPEVAAIIKSYKSRFELSQKLQARGITARNNAYDNDDKSRTRVM